MAHSATVGASIQSAESNPVRLETVKFVVEHSLGSLARQRHSSGFSRRPKSNINRLKQRMVLQNVNACEYGGSEHGSEWNGD